MQKIISMEKSLPSDIGNNKQLESKEEKNEKQDTQLKENIENNEGKINELEERKREIEIRMKEEKEKMEREIEKERERRAEIERREKEIREKEIRERGVGCKGCEWFFNNRKKYFPSTPYNGYSIVDGLRAIGADSSFDYRTQIAIKNGINDYVGSPNQNLHMLDLLKLGKLLRP